MIFNVLEPMLARYQEILRGEPKKSRLQAVTQVVREYLPSAIEDLETLIILGKLEREGLN